MSYPLTANSAARRTGAIAAGVLAADAGSKFAAVVLASQQASLGIIMPMQNPDFSFGIASAALPSMLAVSALGILVFGGYTAWSAARGRMPASIPGLLIGGAMGNLVDRLLFGAVHDWLDLGKVVVNFADLAVLAGLVAYLFWSAIARRQCS
jgi:signal peptidase II